MTIFTHFIDLYPAFNLFLKIYKIIHLMQYYFFNIGNTVIQKLLPCRAKNMARKSAPEKLRNRQPFLQIIDRHTSDCSFFSQLDQNLNESTYF